MINTSKAYQDAIRSNREFRVRDKITFKDGPTITLSMDDLISYSINEATSSSGKFEVGAAVIKEYSIVLNNSEGKFDDYNFEDADVQAIVGIKLADGTWEDLQKGIYRIVSAKSHDLTIQITAYDSMLFFDKSYSECKISYPSTIRQIISSACQDCEMTFDAHTLEMENYRINKRPGDESLTYRDIISFCAQIMGCYARIDHLDQLSFGWYDFGEIDNFHRFYNLKSQSINTDDITITGVVVSADAENGEETESMRFGDVGYLIELSGNPLIQSNGVVEVANHVGPKLKGNTFRPLTVSCQSDPCVEAGDAAYVTDRKDRTYATVITNTTFELGGAQKIECSAETPAEKTYTKYSAETKILSESKNQTEKQLSSYDIAASRLGALMAHSMGMYETTETDSDTGAKIKYMHDKPLLADSKTIWKQTADAFAVSTDGGKTWNAGMDKDGNSVVTVLSAIGVNADWINTGALVVKDNSGRVIFNADVDSGTVDIVANSFSLRGETIEEIVKQETEDYVKEVVSGAVKEVSTQHFYSHTPTLTNLPASQWTTAEQKEAHLDDLFYNISTKKMYRFIKNGSTYSWERFEDPDIEKALDSAAEAKDTADSKRRVFVTTPQPPYDVGDMWVQGSNGDIMRCQTARSSGSYQSGDWIKASKYTDNSALEAFIEGDFADTIEQIESQSDKKAETWYQTSDPSTSWTTSALKQQHVGDIWYNSSSSVQKSYRWNGSTWVEMKSTPPDDVFDQIDGKAQIFISQPRPPYAQGDLWFNSSTSDIMTCVTSRSSGSYTASDWQKRNKYTDDTTVKNLDKNLSQTGVFNRLTNNGQTQGIYLSGGRIYINASYIKSGEISADFIRGGNLAVYGTGGDSYTSFVAYDRYGGTVLLEVTDYGIIVNDERNAMTLSGAGMASAGDYFSRIALNGGDYGYSAGDILLDTTSQIILNASKRIQITTDLTAYVYAPLYCNESVRVVGNLNVEGTKKRIVKTSDYGTVSQYCYEMATPYFGDIGEGILDENGECYIFLCDIFRETVNSGMGYYVFLQKEGNGDIWVEEKKESYVLVKGSPFLKFSWEAKIRQKGFDSERLELYGTEPDFENEEKPDLNNLLKRGIEKEIDYEGEGQSLFFQYCKEQEDIT